MRLKLNITRKVLLYLLMAGILPLILLGWLAFEISRSVVIEQAEAEYGRLAGSFSSYMSLYHGQVEDMAASIAGNEAIGRSLMMADTGAGTTYDRLEMRVQMGRLLNSYMRVKGLVSIDLFSVGGEHFHVGETLNVEMQRQEVSHELLREALAAKSQMLWRGVDDNLNATSSQKKVISALRAIHYFSPATGKSEPVGVMLISLNDEIMHSFLAGLTLARGVQLMQVDRKGVISLHSDAQRFGKPLPSALLDLLRAEDPVREFVLDGEPMLLKLHPGDKLTHMHVVLAPRRLLVEKINFLGVVTLGIVLLCLLGIAALTWYFVRVVVQPIRAVSSGFSQIQALPDAHHAKLPLAGVDGDIDGLVRGYNNLLDAMSEQRKVALELSRSEAERTETETVLLAAMDAIDEAFAVFDANDCLVFCNERFRATYPGCESVAVPGTPYETLLRHIAGLGHYIGPSEKFDRWIEQQLTLHRSGNRFSEEQLRDGRWLRIVERKTVQGQIVGFRVDITALKKAEAAAVAASQAKSNFLATMSHEIRTPMNAILGLLKLLQGTSLSSQQQDYVGKTEGAAHSLLGLLNDILDFSKVEAGKMTLDPQPMRIDQLFRDLAVVLSANVGNKDLEVLFDIDPRLPQAVVCDSMRLQQVLINLGGNAIKFTPTGHIVLAAHLIEAANHAESGQVSIQFSVTDTGIGIAPENQQRIFSGFSQAEASTTRRFGGTGLGLAISQRLVEAMGGNLQLQSSLGQGSSFTFCLKLPEVAATDPPDGNFVASPLPPRRMLVVDDNPAALSLFEQTIRGWGWHVDLAGTCEDALSKARAVNGGDEKPPAVGYDVYLVDWHLSGEDGWEFARRLRDWEHTARLPRSRVILVTGQGRELLAHRTPEEEARVDGCLVKPLTPSMLLDAAVNADTSDARVRQSDRSNKNRRRLAGMRLLVVEDNLINQQVAEELLNSEGAHVSLAANGQQGVEAVAAANPQFDVVLMDIQMPVMDGYEATRNIRTKLREESLPIVAMTANAMDSDRRAALEAGMNAHVGKPFDLNHLVAVIQELAPGRQHGAAGPESLELESSRGQGEAAFVLAQSIGIDLPGALARMGGKLDLYARMAVELVHSLDEAPGRWEAALRAQDIPLLGRELHTIKGLAATLGAGVLSEQFAKAESQCKQTAELAVANAAIAPLVNAVREGKAALESVCAVLTREMNGPADSTSGSLPGERHVAQSHAAPVSVEEFLATLTKLRALMKASDMDVLQEFASHRVSLDAFSADLTQQMDSALLKLDFEAAHQTCDAMEQRYLAKSVH